MDKHDNKQPQKRILIVEDDTNLAEIYSTMLQAEGYNVRLVAKSVDAKAVALDFHPDLVILDVMMPGLNGFDVAIILRGTQETANVKIVMLTALSGQVFIDKANELKVDEFLTKSNIKTTEVVERINKLLA